MRAGAKGKTCPYCHTYKRRNQYYKKLNAPHGITSYCKVCVRATKEAARQRAREYIDSVRQASSCQNCSESRWYVLDFHHRKSADKKYSIADMSDYKIETIQKEIDKCDTLCANCHRELHWKLDKKGKPG